MDDFLVIERKSAELFLRVLRLTAEQDAIKAEQIKHNKYDRWEANHAYLDGRSVGYRQAAEEMRSFFNLLKENNDA